MRSLIIVLASLFFVGATVAQNGVVAAVENNTPTETVVVEEATQQAQFPGSTEALKDFFTENFDYPTIAREDEISGKTAVSVLIDEDGQAKFVRMSGVKAPSIQAEMEKVINAMPKWTPATKAGNAVKQVVKIKVDLALR